MAPKTRSVKDVEKAALTLLRMADPEWNSPDADDDKENTTEDMEQSSSETSDQQM